MPQWIASFSLNYKYCTLQLLERTVLNKFTKKLSRSLHFTHILINLPTFSSTILCFADNCFIIKINEKSDYSSPRPIDPEISPVAKYCFLQIKILLQPYIEDAFSENKI